MDRAAGTRRSGLLPALAGAAAVETVLGAMMVLGRGTTAEAWARSNVAGSAVTALGMAAAAAVVLRDRPGNRLGWVFLTVAHLEALTVLGTGWIPGRPGDDSALVVVVAWVAANAWWLGLMLLAFLPLLFPDGRLPSPRWRPVAAVAMTAYLVGAVVGVGSGLLVEDAFPELGPASGGPLGEAVALVVVVSAVVVLLCCALTALVAMLLRLRAAGTTERGRLSWFVVACLVLVVFEHLPGQPWAGLAGNVAFPLALAVAVVRHDLFGGESLLSRTLVYGVLTGVVLGAVGVGAAVVGSGLAGSMGGILLAAIAVAVGLEPLRRRVQNVVDRLLYGGPRDPYAALRDAGDELARADDDPLGAVTRSLVRSLRVRDAEVLWPPPAPATGVVDVPLDLAPGPVATLRVHLREGRRRLGPEDEHLLHDLLPQVTAAARTASLLDEALAARSGLLRAVEEERRRLRRDLHDGVGPALAGLTLSLSAVEAGLRRDGVPAADVVDRLARQARGCLDEVHGVVENLRPSALDGLGLTGALREHAASLGSGRGGVAFVVDATTGPVLPAAVELAAYRCLTEAMTNVRVHASARRCVVRVEVHGPELIAEVTDDGIGVDGSRGVHPGSGTGLLSMAQRASELGGRMALESSASGTSVRLRIPLVQAAGTLAAR